MSRTVLVTAIGSFSAEAVIRACKRQGYRVVGCDIYPKEWVANSLDTDRFYQAPYATDREKYKAFMTEVCGKEQVDYVMPLTDVEIDVFKDWPDAAEKLGAVICMSDRRTIEMCRDKSKQAACLKSQAVCRTIPGQFLSDVLRKREENGDHAFELLKYPLVIKPVNGRSSQGLHMIEGPKEMAFAVEQIGDDRGKYLVQPKISGRVITVDVVRDSGTGTSVCLPRRELLRTLNGAGISVYVFRDEVLEQQCHKIADALNVHGCVNFEFVEHETEAGEKQWYFLECNPRFSGGVAFSCAAGYDMVKNHLNCFQGQKPEPLGEIKNQYIARRYTEYLMREE